MEVKTQKEVNTVELVKGQFTPSQAREVLVSLLDQKINFHLIEKHQKWEKDHNCDMTDLNKRIEELEEEKRKVKEFLSASDDQDVPTIKLSGNILISYID